MRCPSMRFCNAHDAIYAGKVLVRWYVKCALFVCVLRQLVLKYFGAFTSLLFLKLHLCCVPSVRCYDMSQFSDLINSSSVNDSNRAASIWSCRREETTRIIYNCFLTNTSNQQCKLVLSPPTQIPSFCPLFSTSLFIFSLSSSISPHTRFRQSSATFDQQTRFQQHFDQLPTHYVSVHGQLVAYYPVCICVVGLCIWLCQFVCM